MTQKELSIKFDEIIARLRVEKLPHCICEVDGETILKEGFDIWQNWDLVKIHSREDGGWNFDYYVREYKNCPLCGRPLPVEVPPGEKVFPYDNGYKVY